MTAASPGCLCRIDGEVPSGSAHEDWQQGLGVITRVGDKVFHVVHEIVGHQVHLDGVLLTGDDYLTRLRSRHPHIGL